MMANPEFEFCEQLVRDIREQLTPASTEEEVKQLMLALAQSQGSSSDERTAFVNENFQEMYDFIVDEMDPSLICHALGITE